VLEHVAREIEGGVDFRGAGGNGKRLAEMSGRGLDPDPRQRAEPEIERRSTHSKVS